MYTVLLYSNVKILAFHEMISAGTFSLAKVHHYFELAKKIDFIGRILPKTVIGMASRPPVTQMWVCHNWLCRAKDSRPQGGYNSSN